MSKLRILSLVLVSGIGVLTFLRIVANELQLLAQFMHWQAEGRARQRLQDKRDARKAAEQRKREDQHRQAQEKAKAQRQSLMGGHKPAPAAPVAPEPAAEDVTTLEAV